MHITNFQNNNINNPFNPHYSYHIYEDDLPLDTKVLGEFLLHKEKQLIKEHPPHDNGGTGLSENSVTSRFIYYNLLEFPECGFLKNHIRKAHDTFCKFLEVDIHESYYVQCWFNVMRKGEEIKLHNHAEDNTGYLSGHICVKVADTTTDYEVPYFKTSYRCKNTPGKITLFPGWLSHKVSTIEKDDVRITIAFDIRTQSSYIQHVNDKLKNHWIKI